MKNIIRLVIMSLLLFGCQSNSDKEKLSNELNVYNWSYYIGQTTIKDFEKEFGVEVNYDNYSSNEELLAKLQAGVTGYDVIFPSDYMVKIMIEQNLLATINKNNIPNLQNIDSLFLNLPFDPQNKYSVPYQWGTTGIGVNKLKVKNYTDSWKLLWDMKYKGRITMLDDMRFGLVPALKLLGYSINTTSLEQLSKAKELMFEQKPLVKAYSSDTYIDMLKSGDAWISYGFSGDIYQVARENPDVIYFIPKEGSNIWVDNMCIPKEAPHKYTAEVFINYILRPKVGADITNFTYYASPNEAAKKFINPKILNDPGIYPPDSVLQKCEFLRDVGQVTKVYSQIWNEIKSK